MGKTLYAKLFDSHIVDKNQDGTYLLYIDRHIVHEVTSPQAFEGLVLSGRKINRPESILAVPDHNVPTDENRKASIFTEEDSKIQVETLQENVKVFDIKKFYNVNDPEQGIVHILGPESGFTLPGTTIVCGDSHTSTHGAFGALAFGIGTSEVEHVFATNTLPTKPAKTMLVQVNGDLKKGVTAKDLSLYIIHKIGTAGGTGKVIEYTGDTITGLSMEGRMTLCNMTIEAGARSGLIAPDEKTFDYIKGKKYAPKDEQFQQALEYWKTLSSDDDAEYDETLVIDAGDIKPYTTWGTSPEQAAPILSNIPLADSSNSDAKNETNKRALEYMDLKEGEAISEIEIQKVFIGSCTNGRIEDFRAAAKILKNKKISPSILLALAVPGSGTVKQMAEDEGLHQIFIDAGFQWREPGCSMCLAMNTDKLAPGERCASTSNRNFEGRQGRDSRTHLVSPYTAAASAITGKLTDPTDFLD